MTSSTEPNGPMARPGTNLKRVQAPGSISSPPEQSMLRASDDRPLIGLTPVGRRFTTATLRGRAVSQGQELRGAAILRQVWGGLPGLWFAGPAPDGSDRLWSRPRAGPSRRGSAVRFMRV